MGVFLGKNQACLGSKAEVIGGFILFGIGLKIFISIHFWRIKDIFRKITEISLQYSDNVS